MKKAGSKAVMPPALITINQFLNKVDKYQKNDKVGYAARLRANLKNYYRNTIDTVDGPRAIENEMEFIMQNTSASSLAQIDEKTFLTVRNTGKKSWEFFQKMLAKYL